MVRDPDRISRNAHKFAFCKLLRARLNGPPPLHRLLSQARDTQAAADIAEDTPRQARLDLLAASGRFP